MVLVIGGSLLLFAARGHKVRSRVNNALWSRESLLLANNVLLVAAMLVVLLGTLLPLVHKQLGLGSISIGEPFFNTMFTWLMVPFALLLGVGPLVRWGRDRPRKIRNLLIIAFISTLVLSLLLPWLFESKVVAMTVLAWQWPAGLRCWQLRKLRYVFHAARKPPSVIGGWWRPPGAGSDNCWHCL